MLRTYIYSQALRDPQSPVLAHVALCKETGNLFANAARGCASVLVWRSSHLQHLGVVGHLVRHSPAHT